MLDENLPTFRTRPSPDNPLSQILYFTQNGSEATPGYMLRRPDPTLPTARQKYAAALCDPFSPDVVYGEVLIEPAWTQPALSAAEVRAQQQQQQQGGAGPAAQSPLIPDTFTVLLYNPDQAVPVHLVAGGWNKSDSWEFEMPTLTFKLPSSSVLDRQKQQQQQQKHNGSSAGGGGAAGGAASDLTPRVMFRWKKDGKLSKDMTCYMTGRRLGGRKSKEPDITVALFKAARDSAVQIYEPNLRRVEVEDMKGLEVVILLAAEVVKDLWLMPRNDVFNMAAAPNGPRLRKNSRPPAAGPGTPAMSGALGRGGSESESPPRPSPLAAHGGGGGGVVVFDASSVSGVHAETRRLRAMVEREEREREQRERAEEKRIRRMLEEEERARRLQEAEVAKETERLRQVYGTEGQELPSAATSRPPTNPSLPPRPQAQRQRQQQQQQQQQTAALPRPVSAGPVAGPFGQPVLNSWWHGSAGPSAQQNGQRRNGSAGGGGGLNVPTSAAAMGGLFGRNRLGAEDDRRNVQKKRSLQW
ncbi:hypothetical protein P8C59_004617 [Phyllachora maydis]|uniref:Uncharacterized protein n=1 Tax=Phyllachora maydis TaxID=1825666 RepID=A0AAD9I2N2_9PEZI|nr:hypothetical protein P8C59_004617 [Phyllachora maydis]